jgi:hypothetical protein
MRPSALTRRAGALLSGLCVLLTGCSSAPITPTYSQEELKSSCQRRGGVWHADGLIGGFCEVPRGTNISSSATS